MGENHLIKNACIMVSAIFVYCLISVPSAIGHSPLISDENTRLAPTNTPPVPDIAVTIIPVLLPSLLGIAVIRIVMKNREKVDAKKRAFLTISGIIGLFLWALVGSVLASMASVMPARKTKSLGEKEKIGLGI